jgi:YaiO family outer membrane protein
MASRFGRAAAVGALVLGLAIGPAARAAEDEVAAAIERQDFARATQLLRAELAVTPGSETARFQLARVLGWNGNNTAALAEYDALVAASPGNVDYALGRAQTLARIGQDEAALAEIRRARALAPAYEDVWRLEFSLLRRDGPASRESLDTLRANAALRFPDALWWRNDAVDTASEARTELRLTGERQSLSSKVDDWSSVAARVTHSAESGRTYHAAWQRDERFGESDTVVAGGLSFAASSAWTTGVDLAFGPDAEFLPETSAAGWATRPLADAWETTLRLRHRRYESAIVTSLAGTAARYFGKYRAAYTIDIARLRGEASSLAQVATLNYYRSERLQLDLTIASGKEAESIAPGRVLKTGIRAVTVGSRVQLNERWQLNAWLGTQRQGDLYRRSYLGVSLATGL